MREFQAIQLDDSQLCLGASEQVLQQAERELAVALPVMHREFLKFADGGFVGNFIFYSAGDGVHPAERLIAADRRNGPDCPIFAIGRDASDDFGFLRSDLSNSSPAVHFLSHETWELVKATPSFREFLIRIAGLKPGESLVVDVP